MVRINEEGKLEGKVSVKRQLLNGGKDVGDYEIVVDFDGANIQTVVDHAMNDYVIQLRKSVKDRPQAEALAKGVKFGFKYGAAAKDPNVIAATLPVDELKDEALDDLIRRLQARKAKNLQTGEDIE